MTTQPVQHRFCHDLRLLIGKLGSKLGSKLLARPRGQEGHPQLLAGKLTILVNGRFVEPDNNFPLLFRFRPARSDGQRRG